MELDQSITENFGVNLAELLAGKIIEVYPEFDQTRYVEGIYTQCRGLSLKQRLDLHASCLRQILPEDYPSALAILMRILGPENPEETGMFKHYAWMMPIGTFIETYGLDYFDLSMQAIEELTKRNTGEYAIRPYIRRYPEQAIARMHQWAQSENFHLRRLASEGLRPKLPWSSKLNTFIEHPQPVFEILNLLKEDEIMFVKKSVANHLTDYLKVNKAATLPLIKSWRLSNNKHTQWILKRATRKISIDET